MLKPAFVLLAALWAGLSIGRPVDAQRAVELNTANDGHDDSNWWAV